MPNGASKRSGQKVLIVDDNPLQRAMTSQALESAGYFVREAENGLVALREIEASQFDLVMLDVLMPEMDGYETCRRLRENPETKDIPVLMVTGLEDVGSVEKAFEVGATNFMTKPLNVQLLNHHVRYILRSSAERASRKQAEQKIRALNETLEKRVEERTAALTDLNRQLENEIAERVQANIVLSDTQAHLRGIMDNMADLVITMDEHGIIESANPVCEVFFGWGAEEIIGGNVALLMPELDRSNFDGYLKAHQDSCGEKFIGDGRREVTAKRKDRSLFPMSLAISEMSLGGRRCFIGVGRDITDRKKYEAEILARAYQQSAVVKLSRQALQEEDLNVIYTSACALVAQTLEMEMAGIFERLPHSESLELRGSVGWDQEADGQTKVPLAEDNPAGLAFQTGAAVVIDDWVFEKRFSDSQYICKPNVVSSGFVPIVGQSRTYGVLEVHSKKFQDLSKEDMAFLEAITNVLSAAIERRQAEQAAEKHSTLLEATFQNMSQGVAVFDGDWKLAAFNPQFAEILDYPPDLLSLGMGRKDILRFRAQRGDFGDGDIESLVRSAVAKTMESKSSERTLANGRTYLHERTPMPNSGFISTATDITERKRAEKKLAAQSALLETTIETMAQGVVVYDADERLISFNGQYEKLMGFPTGFLHRGMHLKEVLNYLAETGQFGPGDPEELCRERIERFRTGSEKTGERTLADGTAYIYHRKVLPGGGFVTTFTDLTGQKKTEQQVLAQAALLGATFQNMSQGVAVYDGNMKLAAFNPQFGEILDYPPDLLKLGMDREEVLRFRARKGVLGDGDTESLVRSAIENTMASKSGERTLANGRTYIHERTPMPDGGFISTATDITERKRAEGELAAQSALLETTVETMAHGVVVFDVDEHLMSFNGQYEELMGFPPGFLQLGMYLEEIVRYRAEDGQLGQGDPDELCREHLKTFRTGSERTGERTLSDGTAYVYHRKKLPGGGSVTTFTDLTEQKKAEQKILARSYQQSAVAELSRQALQEEDPNVLYTNACALVAQTLGMNMAGILEPLPDGESLGLKASVGWQQESLGQTKVLLAEDNPTGLAFQTSTSVVINDWVNEQRFSGSRYLDEHGAISSGFAPIVGQSRAHGVLEVHSKKGQYIDKEDIAFLEAITNVLGAAIERIHAEQVLENQSNLLQTTVESMAQGFAVFDADFGLLHFNEHYARLFEFPPGFLRIGLSWKEIAGYRAEQGQYGDGGAKVILEERVERSRDRRERTGERTLPNGTVYVYHRKSMPGGGFVNTYTDVTERKNAEKTHQELTGQLYQSQKMEAVGQLAGGVAHDFNNILMVIDGYTRTARMDPDLPENVQAPLDKVLLAAEKAAGLTKQLLVFGRRQVLETKVIKADSILPDLQSLLRPLLGETIDLQIAHVEEEIFIATDVAQLTQALVNLVINARDAMPAGGAVSISMASAEADDELLSRNSELPSGTCLRIDVADKGEGMDEDTLASIFEPFFTTKEQGKGTGLGLAMVYGFVTQSKGAIEVESALGKGSKFSIYLPTTDDPVEVTVEMDDGDLMAHGETILLAEDDDTLRDLVRANLEALGYTVLTACDGFDALEVEMDHEGPIDLLLSDVVMPSMGGIELAKVLQETRPDTKVLLMSGYPARGDIKQVDLPAGIPLIQKPCTPTRLARAVRDTIEERETV